MSFHECGGNVGDDVHIPLPAWITEIGLSNPDIYFTDRKERRNTECLSWGIDKERVLRGRTAVEVLNRSKIVQQCKIFLYYFNLKTSVVTPFLVLSCFMFLLLCPLKR